MYDDPSYVRDNEIKLRLNDVELAVVASLARLNNRRRAVFARELLMAAIARFEAKTNEQARAA